MYKSVLWAEDLEGHRQPSLYYLDDNEGVDGPHLICDWNGAPTDVCEFDVDILKLMKEHADDDNDDDDDESLDAASEEQSQHQQHQQQRMHDQQEAQNKSDMTVTEDFVDYPNPAAEITKTTKTFTSRGNSLPVPIRRTDLIVEDCAHLDFLSVPPITAGLLKRIVRNLQQRNQAQAVNNRKSSGAK